MIKFVLQLNQSANSELVMKSEKSYMPRLCCQSAVLLLWTCLFCFGHSTTTANETTSTTPTDNAKTATNVVRFKTGDVNAGKKLYKRYCRGCHGVDGRGGAHTFMPHIGKLTKKGYIDLLPDSYLYLVIELGGEAVGKNSYMPAWKKTLSETQIKDVIAFIRSMPLY